MAKIKFTATSLATFVAEAGPTQPKVVWDTETRGLGAYVNSGRSGTLFVQFRVGTKQRKVTLGRITELSVPEARKSANEILVAARQGKDIISEQRASQRSKLTLRDAFAEYKLALQRRGASPTTLKLNDAIWKKLGRYGDSEVSRITKRDVRAWHTAWGKHGPSAANQTARLLRTIYNYAARFTEDMPPNPCTAIEWFSERGRRNVIRWEDLPLWWSQVEGLENPVRRAYWKLLLMSGLRRLDAASIRWSEVGDAGVFRPNPKGGRTRAFTLPMTDQLRTIFAEARAAVDLLSPGSKVVFPANSATGHITEMTEKAFPTVTPHDLRRTYATASAEAGIDPYTIKVLLNHAVDKGDVTARYVQPSKEHVQRSAQTVADHIDRIVNGKGTKALGN